MGDLNAKVENDNRNYEKAMEREGPWREKDVAP